MAIRERRLYDASVDGRVESLNELMQEDKLTLARVSVTSFNETPLHVAAMLGHVDFAKALLEYKRDLVSRLDSQGRSPLHLAAANGYVEIVKLLLVVNSDVCIVGDEDRRTPLHLAVMNGQTDVVRELVRGISHEEMLRYTLDRGETILHTCVIYNRLEALKVVVELRAADDNSVNIKDDNGNTVLHIATSLKQSETVKYLLGRKAVKLNETNGNGFTAFDIIEHVPRDLKSMEIQELLATVGTLPARKLPGLAHNTTQVVTKGNQNEISPPVEDHQPTSRKKKSSTFVKRLKTKKNNWVEKKRDSLMVAATVIAAVAYQAGLNPPGGVWQVDTPVNGKNTTYDAGTSVMAAKFPTEYVSIVAFNTLSFVSSLSIILLLVSGLPLKRRFFMWLLMVAMWLTLTFMGITYLLSLGPLSREPMTVKEITQLVSKRTLPPNYEGSQYQNYTIFIVAVGVVIWLAVVAIVSIVHTCRVIFWIIKKVVRLFRKREISEEVNQKEDRGETNV